MKHGCCCRYGGLDEGILWLERVLDEVLRMRTIILWFYVLESFIGRYFL